MRYFARLLTLALVGLVPCTAAPAHADTYGQLANFLFRGQFSGGGQSAVSTETPIILKFIPTTTNQSGTVTVAANGDITLKVGASSAEAADTSVKCPSGGSSGIIDVSDAACDTLGEVVDIINGSSNWRAVILDGLRTDSSNDTLITLSETANPTRAQGVGLLADSTVALTVTRALSPCRDFTCGYLTRGGGAGSPYALVANPWKGLKTVLWKATETITTGGANTWNIYSVDVNNTTTGTETATLLWTEAGGASTTANSQDWTTIGLFSYENQKMVVRVTATSTLTAAKFVTNAMTYPIAIQ